MIGGPQRNPGFMQRYSQMPLSSRAQALFSAQTLVALACLAIVIVGTSLRLVGTDWDEGSNLHPDERHMMFIAMDSIAGFQDLPPGSLTAGEIWFGTGTSPLDPRRKGQLYVYGELPHIAVVMAARVTGQPGWPEIMLMARTLGSAVDGYTILAVFLLAFLSLRSATAALTAAALYAFTPLAIQNANFFTVDAWMTAASAWCLVAATMIMRSRPGPGVYGWVAVSGILAGLALACKLPGLALTGVLAVSIFCRHLREGTLLTAGFAGALGLGLLSAFFAFRLACPFHFQGPGFFGLWPAQAAINGYVEMSGLVMDFGFPPNWQWLAGYSKAQALFDFAVWGLGPAISIAVIVGFAVLVLRRRPNWHLLMPLGVFCAVLLAYWLSGAILALRYVLPATVALCVIAGAGLAAYNATSFRAFAAFIVAAAGCWSLGMVTIHHETHSRVAASRWLWANTPAGSVLINESPWDDALPVPVRRPGRTELIWPGLDDDFSFLSLNLEYPDDEQKARNIAGRLDQADYLIVSSDRMRKPILALSERFPLTTAYYGMLASGDLCFERIYERRPGYRVLGVTLDDSDAQETWTVYDHPSVEIYRKTGCYDREQTERRLLQALKNGS